jgi:hypothetical protein
MKVASHAEVSQRSEEGHQVRFLPSGEAEGEALIAEADHILEDG